MEYFFLKLGAGNNEANLRLSKRPPEAAVYFDGRNERAYQRGAGKSQPRHFWERGQKENWKNTTMVVIHAGRIWLLQPAGVVRFKKPFWQGRTRLTPKVMPVKRMKFDWCKNVPPVLAGMGSSQHHGRRTFTQIGHWGNLKAIDCVLGRAFSEKARQEDHWQPKKQKAAQLLECLGSTELETLVGKLFECHGCHVPAYLGGTLKDIDILAYNDTRKPIHIGRVTVPVGKRVSIQVKTWKRIARPKSVDYLIGLDVISGPRAFGAAWLLARVKECPEVLAWLKRSLNWLPPEFLARFGL